MIEKILNKPTIVYCEPISNWLIKRPFYALSNLPFLLAGTLILFKEKGDGKLKMFGYCAILISIFSTLYDTFDAYIFQIFDLTMMFVFASYLLYLNLSRIFTKMDKSLIPICSVLVFASLIPLTLFEGFTGSIIFGAFTLMIILTEGYLYSLNKNIDYKPWLIGFAFFIVGFGFWFTDVTKIYCHTFGLLNGRSVFHFLTAITIYFIYDFYSNQTYELRKTS